MAVRVAEGRGADRRRAAGVLGVRQLGAARSRTAEEFRRPGALVVRDRPRLGRRGHVRAWRRKPLRRLEPDARVQQPQRLCRGGAVAAVSRLEYEIEAMRRYSAIAGYVITELTDAHWESNGLLDMRR